MDTKCLEQSPCPTGTLPVKHCQVGRPFRPTASIRNLYDFIRTGEIAHISYHAGNEVHVFGKRGSIISSGSNRYRTVEKTESTGNIRHAIDSGPPHLANQIGTHIFQILESGIGVRGVLTSTICPSFTTHPFAINIVPLTAITCFSEDIMGEIQR